MLKECAVRPYLDRLMNSLSDQRIMRFRPYIPKAGRPIRTKTDLYKKGWTKKKIRESRLRKANNLSTLFTR